MGRADRAAGRAERDLLWDVPGPVTRVPPTPSRCPRHPGGAQAPWGAQPPGPARGTRRREEPPVAAGGETAPPAPPRRGAGGDVSERPTVTHRAPSSRRPPPPLGFPEALTRKCSVTCRKFITPEGGAATPFLPPTPAADAQSASAGQLAALAPRALARGGRGRGRRGTEGVT